jgi:hypothetical protein
MVKVTPPKKPRNVIFRRYRKLPNGTVLDAFDYGLKACLCTLSDPGDVGLTLCLSTGSRPAVAVAGRGLSTGSDRSL